jgi:predicted PurR-regulated permease PerM
VSLPPGLTLSAQLLMGVLAGFLGLALATPLAVVFFVVFQEMQAKSAE